MEKISIVILMVIFCRFFVGKISKQALLNSAKCRMNSSEPGSTVPCEELPAGAARLL